MKLVGFDFPPDLRQHFKGKVDNWLFEIQALRFDPYNRMGSFKFYFDPLFDYPFGGVEIENMSKMMAFTSCEYGDVRRTKTPEQMVEWLRQFHTELAERLHNGEECST
ncbi:MAG TPA: hypothetical protein VME41_01560 [Stellaceae bacterium]|nr:hypothetical protein [Stellaceae bacterium]